MKKTLLLAFIATALAMPALAQSPVPTAHSPARHGPIHHKKPVHHKAKKPMSTAQKANADRMKQCGAQWKADKVAGRVGASNQQKWPQYWSACNKRLKG